MTSNSTPSPLVASASSEYPGGYEAYRAFDGVKSNDGWWTSSGSSGWLKLDFGSGNTKTITKYAITGQGTTYLTSNPKNWTFEGSNDNSNWTVLNTQSNISMWTNFETKIFTFTNTNAYRYYRLNISVSVSSSYVAVGELEMMETPSSGVIASQWSSSKGWAFIENSGDLTFNCSINGSTTLTKSVAWSPSSDNWYHLVVSRSGNNLRFFVNGVQQGATQDVTGFVIFNSAANLTVGTD